MLVSVGGDLVCNVRGPAELVGAGLCGSSAPGNDDLRYWVSGGPSADGALFVDAAGRSVATDRFAVDADREVLLALAPAAAGNLTTDLAP